VNDTGLFSQLVLRVSGGLLHFVWQGAALAVLAAMALALLERQAARTRYAIAVGFLAAMLAAPLLTVLFFNSADAILSGTLQILGQPPVSRLKTEQWASWIAVIWLAGVTTGTIRLAIGWRLSLRMIRRACVPEPEITALFNRLVEQTQSGAVRLLVSARAASPVVIGWLRPVVLLPVRVLTGLSSEELRAVLAHELAHVRRHDYLVNILQRVVESLLFYHPAVWWLSTRVRTERELAADDDAIALCDDPAILARALLRLEETRSDRVAAIAATGGNVARRVARILKLEPDRPGWQPIMATVSFIALWATAGLWPFAAAPPQRPTAHPSPIQARAAAAISPVQAALTTGLGALAAVAPAAPQQPPPTVAPPQNVPSEPIIIKSHAEVRRLTGQVRDSIGQTAPPGILIIAKPEVRTIPNISSYIQETDRQGRYQFNIPPGRYTISIEDRRRNRLRTLEAPQRRVTVPAEQDRVDLDLEFTTIPINESWLLSRSRDELWGRIEFDDGSELPVGALSSFQVILSSPGARFTTQPFTNTQGLFTLPAAAGTFTVRIAPLWLGYYLKSMTAGNVDLMQNPLVVKEGAQDSDIRIVLTKTRPADTPPGVKVSGRVTDWKPGNRDLGLLAILGSADTFHVANITPENNGSFEINGVPPGQYALGSGLVRAFFIVDRADVTNLSLTQNNPEFPASTPVPFTGSGSYIRGFIEAGGAAIPQFEVRITAALPGGSAPPPYVIEVFGPEFSIILPEAAYRLSVSGLPSGYSLKSVTAGPLDLTEPFLITYKGVADRFSGAAVAASGITIKLTAPAQ